MLLLPRAQALFQRSKFAFIYFLIDFLDQLVATTAWRKILLHFRVPSLFFKLLKPVCQFPALWLGELLNRGFDCFHGHIASLTMPSSKCKSEPGRPVTVGLMSHRFAGRDHAPPRLGSAAS